ncbi:MAG TPA: hypothetical protein VMW03_04230 [Candidatus Krumholzibacteriaceae bacterium]|nr:hypothetical protein [Candidatus Krumholzibacteriaceae bacterium]
MRHSFLFFALCSALDELVTFRNLSVGGVEFNPRVAWLISINPLLYPLADAAIIAVAWVADRLLTKRQVDPWIIWATAGLARVLCFTFSLVH